MFPKLTICRTYADVFEAIDTQKHQLVALKIITIDPEEGTPSNRIREIGLLSDVDHRNIINLLDFHYTLCELILVTELFETDLSKYIHNQCVSQIYSPPLNDIKFIVYQILDAVSYLHQHKAKIIHRDIKPQNVLMNPGMNLHVKLADFGLARSNSIPLYSGAYSSEVVTLWYRAPE